MPYRAALDLKAPALAAKVQQLATMFRWLIFFVMVGVATSQSGHHGEAQQQGGRNPGGPPGGGPPDRWGGLPPPGGSGRDSNSSGGAKSGPSGPGGSVDPYNPSLKDEIGMVRRRLKGDHLTGDDGQLLVSLATSYLDRSAQAERNKKQRVLAARWFASAAALQQAIDLLQKPLDSKSPVTRERADAQIETVYFRLRQADDFLKTSDEADAKPLADISRRWYQKSLQLLESDPADSERHANAATLLIAALESLAQASALQRQFQKLK
jgi:hypothetical protein